MHCSTVQGVSDEGCTNVPAEYPPPRADTRVPRADGKQERADRVETASRQRAETPDRQRRIVLARFRPEARIRRRAEFQQVYEHGSRISWRHATIFLLPNTREVGRLGIAATRKLGGAVQRNRAKRLIREVFRRNNIAPGFDVVVVPKRELLDASLTVLEAEYRNSLERRLRPRRPDGAQGLQGLHFAVFPGLLPLPAFLRGLHRRSHRTIRGRARHLAGHSPPRALPPALRRRP